MIVDKGGSLTVYANATVWNAGNDEFAEGNSQTAAARYAVQIEVPKNHPPGTYVQRFGRWSRGLVRHHHGVKSKGMFISLMIFL